MRFLIEATKMAATTVAGACQRLGYAFIVILAGVWLIVLSPVTAGTADFCRWLEDFRTEVRSTGISDEVLDSSLAGINEPLPAVIELDRRQPETLRTSAEYVSATVTPARVKQGKRMLERYPAWLGIIERKYAVEPRFLVALWGIETDYGRSTGRFPVIHSLVTLAYDGRRGSFFRQELIEALRIIESNSISLSRMRGSWSGAMGQCQFMPSTFVKHAVDADGDGQIDLWQSVPDALASAANYLAAEGWRHGQIWGHPVNLPGGFEDDHTGLDKRLPLSVWRHLGVRHLDGKDLPQSDIEASLVVPDGPNGKAYLVYDNFRVLMRWNRSTSFALAVGILADRIDTP